MIPPDFTTFWNQASQQGLQAEGRLDRQGDPVPGRGRSPRQERQQPFLRGLVVAEPSVQVVADRTIGERDCRRLREIHGQAVDAADRLRARAVRARRRRGEALGRRRRQQGGRAGDRRDQARHGGRPDRLGTARNCRRSPRRTSPRRRWSAASGGYATATSTTSSSPTTKPHRKSRSAARWSRSRKRRIVPNSERPSGRSAWQEWSAGPGWAGARMGSGVILRLDNLTRSFGSLKAIDDVQLEVAAGEALGIIGPNGAGKSTLFNLITGLQRPDAGTIHFDGRDITSAPPRARCIAGIGRSFQIPHPFENLTVFENLLVAAIHGRRKREAEVVDACGDILERTGLIGFANRSAGTLNLLGRKRLELARALASAPRLLLLDEIAGGLTEAECLRARRAGAGHQEIRRDDRLDRAHRACAARRRFPIGRAEFRTQDHRRRAALGHGLRTRSARSTWASRRETLDRKAFRLEALTLAVLETLDLTAFYGDFQALFGITFRSRRGRNGRHHRRQRRRKIHVPESDCRPAAAPGRSRTSRRPRYRRACRHTRSSSSA